MYSLLRVITIVKSIFSGVGEGRDLEIVSPTLNFEIIITPNKFNNHAGVYYMSKQTA